MNKFWVGIFALIMVTILACSEKDGVVDVPNLNYTDTPINWVASSVLYDTTIVKKELSLVYFYADW